MISRRWHAVVVVGEVIEVVFGLSGVVCERTCKRGGGVCCGIRTEAHGLARGPQATPSMVACRR
jgi:hypothetical protein